MCQELTPLAVSSEFRCIHRCEHGTIHLTWDIATTYLDLDMLAQVVDLTRQGQTLQTPGQVDAAPCRLFLTKKGYFQLWIRNTGLALSRVDFEIFADMVRVAFRQIVETEAQTPSAQQDLVCQRTVKASARQSFSNN